MGGGYSMGGMETQKTTTKNKQTNKNSRQDDEGAETK